MSSAQPVTPPSLEIWVGAANSGPGSPSNIAELEAWSDRLLDAKALDEVFQDLPH